jgi:hypothetical protein
MIISLRPYNFLAMNQSSFSPTPDDNLRKRLMTVEGTMPQLLGINRYGRGESHSLRQIFQVIENEGYLPSAALAEAGRKEEPQGCLI